MTDEERIVEEVSNRLQGKKVRVTYHASEMVYYETVIEANSREEADKKYYNMGNLDVASHDGFETYDVHEEEI